MFPTTGPAKRGEFVSLYCTGLGDLSSHQPSITLGGTPAPVSFAGQAPGFVGLNQVNFQIPNTAPTGDAVAISLTIAGIKSNTATIAIQ